MWLIRRFFILAKLNYLCWDSLHKIMRVKLLGIQVNEMWVKKLHIWKEWTKGLYMWKRTIDLMNQCLLSFGSNLANKISLCGFLLVPLECIGKIWLYVLLWRICEWNPTWHFCLKKSVVVWYSQSFVLSPH